MIWLDQQEWHIECTPTSILHSMWLLESHKHTGHRHFFVVYTPPCRRVEFAITQGYDAVFFVAHDGFPNVYAWDIVLYDSHTHEAVAGIAWREESAR